MPIETKLGSFEPHLPPADPLPAIGTPGTHIPWVDPPNEKLKIFLPGFLI